MRLLPLILAAFVACTSMAQAAPANESAFDRVIRTNTLRCGYVVVPPELSKDPNSGELSGVTVDVMKEIGERLNLKVEWTEEVTFPTMAAGLETGRYDAICFSLYRMASAARVMHSTRPLFYSRTNIYVRANDTRFDGHVAALNAPEVKIATVDGEMAEIIARNQFPQAQIVSMPQTTDLGQMLLSVATGKADVAFVNGVVASGYLKANPGQLKVLATNQPLRVFSHALAVGAKETELGNLLDSALNEMDEQGVLDRILTKHELLPNSYLRTSQPYRE